MSQELKSSKRSSCLLLLSYFFWGGRCSFFSGLGVSESKVQGLFVFVVVTVGREEEESML
jgi:hypothetical protein